MYVFSDCDLCGNIMNRPIGKAFDLVLFPVFPGCPPPAFNRAVNMNEAPCLCLSHHFRTNVNGGRGGGAAGVRCVCPSSPGTEWWSTR